jgi:hypothetical protein
LLIWVLISFELININSALEFAGLKMAGLILAISRTVSYSNLQTPVSIPFFCCASILVLVN